MHSLAVCTAIGLMALQVGGCRSSCHAPCDSVASRPNSPAPPSPTQATTAHQVFLDMVMLSPTDGMWCILPGPGGARQRVLSEGEAKTIRDRVEGAGARYRVLQAPKVLALSGQEATVFVGDTPRDQPEDWTGFRLAVVPRVVSSGQSVVIDRLHVERREEGLSRPQVVDAADVQVLDGQTLLVAPPKVAGSVGEDVMVLVTVRVLPAS